MPNLDLKNIISIYNIRSQQRENFPVVISECVLFKAKFTWQVLSNTNNTEWLLKYLRLQWSHAIYRFLSKPVKLHKTSHL